MNSRLIRAVMLFDAGRALEAEVELRAALKEGEESAEAHALLGLCLLHAGLIEDAEKEVEASLRLAPNNSYCHYARSLVLEKMLRYVKPFGRDPVPAKDARSSACMESARTAIALAPGNEQYLLHLAHLFQLSNQWRESVTLAKEVLRDNPESVAATLVLARVLTSLKHRAKAHSLLVRALALNPEDSIVHADMGWVLLQTGDHQGARRFFEEAMRISANLEWAQAGAIECAKYEFWHYRWCRRFAQWFEDRNALTAVVCGILLAVAITAALTVFFKWIEPFLRARLGKVIIAWCYGSFLILVIIFVLFHDHILQFLIRRHTAAHTSSGVEQRSAALRNLGIVGVAFGAVVLVGLLGNTPGLGMALLCGLIPGTCSFFVVRRCFLPGKIRRLWMSYSGLLLILGMVIAITCRKQIEAWPPAAIFLALLISVLPVALAADYQKRNAPKADHRRKVAALSHKQEGPESHS